VAVLLDHVAERLGLAVSEGGAGEGERSAVHEDSWALNPRSWELGDETTLGTPIVADS
jgi:hypothetical protein